MEASRAPKTLGDRLRFAIEHQPKRGRERGLRLFQRRLEERAEELRRMDQRAPEGTALSSIQGYLADGVVPSLTFVEEAARVLGVRKAWLAFGTGHPTEEEQSEAERLAEGLRRTEERTAAPVIVEIWNGVGDRVPGFWHLPHSARLAVIQGFSRFARSPSAAQRGPTQATFASLMERFGRYFEAPFVLTGIDPEVLSPPELALVHNGLLTAIDVAYWVAEVKVEEADHAVTDASTTGGK